MNINNYKKSYVVYTYTRKNIIVKISSLTRNNYIKAFDDIHQEIIEDFYNADIIKNMYCYSLIITNSIPKFKKEFNNINDIDKSILNIFINKTKSIDLMERFNKIYETCINKKIYHIPSHDIYNVLILKEIDDYKINNQSGTLLSKLKQLYKFENIESVIEMLNVNYKDLTELYAYFIDKRFELNNLIFNKDLIQAEKLVSSEEVKFNNLFLIGKLESTYSGDEIYNKDRDINI